MKQMAWIVTMALTLVISVISFSAKPAMAQRDDKKHEVHIVLAGATINGVVAEGEAEYKWSSRSRSLEVEAGDVNLPNGTTLTVSLNGASIGTMNLVDGEGRLRLSTKTGTVPAIKPGDVLTISDPTGTTVLQGKF